MAWKYRTNSAGARHIIRAGEDPDRRSQSWEVTSPTTALFQDAVDGDRDKDIEVLVLRHQLAVLQRQVDTPAFTPGDRLLFAGLLQHLGRLSAQSDQWPAGLRLLRDDADLPARASGRTLTNTTVPHDLRGRRYRQQQRRAAPVGINHRLLQGD
ncbi:hypothetical protein OHA73_38090 [Streptomyces sp. NBC_00483]